MKQKVTEFYLDENGKYQKREIEIEIDDKEPIDSQIKRLKLNLANTDYIDNKLTEAIANYVATGDNTRVIELRAIYANTLSARQEWRDEINRLQKDLEEV